MALRSVRQEGGKLAWVQGHRIFLAIDSLSAGSYLLGMWTHGRASAGARTAILAVLIYLALVLPMLSGFAGARHLGAAGPASVEVLCAEHDPVSGGSDNQQHNPAQHDTCCLFGCQFAGWVGIPLEAAVVVREPYAAISNRPPPGNLASRLASRSPLPLGSRAPPVFG
jgi:hypothetical protein